MYFSVMFDVTVVIAEDLIFNWFILFLLFLIGTINVLILVMLAKFPQTRTVGFAAPLGKFEFSRQKLIIMRYTIFRFHINQNKILRIGIYYFKKSVQNKPYTR